MIRRRWPIVLSEQEVTDSPTTAGEGDRVRIPGTGKALWTVSPRAISSNPAKTHGMKNAKMGV